VLVPAVQKVREAAARPNSTTNLKQLGLGALSFQDVNRHLPFNGSDQPSPLDKNTPYSKNAVGNNPRSGTWAFQMLPFIEQQALFTAPNRAFGVQTFLCPARARPAVETTNGGGAWTDYFYNNYLNDPMQANRPDAPDMRRSLMKITDGTSNTVFAGHGNISVNQYSMSGGVTLSSNIFNGGTTGTMRAGQSARANPGGVTLARDSFNMPTVGSWGGPFPSGALMVFCDGSVRLVPYNTPNFGAALTPDGGEVLLLP
jgi:hypothetical protein